MKDYFATSEFWNKPKMSQAFLEKLNQFREELSMPMTITSSNNPADGHVKGSDHYEGKAIDFITSAQPVRVFELAKKYKFGGIGLYRNTRGVPYYHLAYGGKDKNDIWIGYLQKDGKIAYYVSNEKNLSDYFNKKGAT